MTVIITSYIWEKTISKRFKDKKSFIENEKRNLKELKMNSMIGILFALNQKGIEESHTLIKCVLFL